MLTQEEAKKILNLAEDWVMAERAHCNAIEERHNAYNRVKRTCEDMDYMIEFFNKEDKAMDEATQAKIAYIKFWNGLFDHTEKGGE